MPSDDTLLKKAVGKGLFSHSALVRTNGWISKPSEYANIYNGYVISFLLAIVILSAFSRMRISKSESLRASPRASEPNRIISASGATSRIIKRIFSTISKRLIILWFSCANIIKACKINNSLCHLFHALGEVEEGLALYGREGAVA